MADDERTRRNTVKACITWLHARANTMNDPSARAAMNTAAFHMGVEFKTHNPVVLAPAVSEEQIARVIDPNSWCVMDSYLDEALRKLRRDESIDLDAFKHKQSMAKAREILRMINGGGA